MKEVYFSEYIDEENIVMDPPIYNANEDTLHRYSLTLSFRDRKGGGHAIVILKNPSKAGKEDNTGRRLSDDTIYKVSDYLYKKKSYQKITILNLFTIVSGMTGNIRELIGTSDEQIHRNKNNNVLLQLLDEDVFNEEKDRIFAAWGDYSKLLESQYKKRIREVLGLIGDKPLYRVGSMVNGTKYPGHGKYWYDYEEVLPYPQDAVR
ncbi:DUF1643 domain-containing protein [Lysinibacillus parviboronicapiens]|uniref:DUF1643 domain-containing protein n=1 Tax=Lysinibacillus parviboronicapiens TaxID=436516 RepID=UPI000D3751EB|nr:DUF1643 domain-containing protein [Lysinibacillus parviboronicapiens]